MVKSMTGYGRAVETINGREFTVEIRSVNNRYLDCSVKLPRSLSFAEDAVKQAVKNTISRGKVDVFISVHSEGAADVKVTLNAAMVEGYLAAMKQMVESYGIQDDISVSVISRMPEVFTVEKPEVDEEKLLSDLMCVVAKALESYDAMRTTEGKALENDLRSRGTLGFTSFAKTSMYRHLPLIFSTDVISNLPSVQTMTISVVISTSGIHRNRNRSVVSVKAARFAQRSLPCLPSRYARTDARISSDVTLKPSASFVMTGLTMSIKVFIFP